MENSQKYYIGLDMGTSSLGWAVTTLDYRLMRAKGKDLWGVRLFEEADTAVERRQNRISRRRRQREMARIGLVKEYFEAAIHEVDPGFCQRCEESKYWKEDRSEDNQQPYALFADKTYTDIDYYKEFPTIFHLRKKLLTTTEPQDVRLVYLAVINMFKHRGHFLNTGLEHISELGNMEDLVRGLEAAAVNVELSSLCPTDVKLFEEILTKRDISRSVKKEKLLQLLDISKTKEKRAAEFVGLLSGLKAKVSVLFGDYITDEELLKKSISFQDSDFEEIYYSLEKDLPEDEADLVDTIKQIYDVCLLSTIRKGYVYLSQARVADYEKHKQDLKDLQMLVRKYCPEEYHAFFRTMGTDNYSAYVGSVNYKKEKQRRSGKVLSRELFYSTVKKLLSKMPQDDSVVEKIYHDIEIENFMSKQLTASNGVVPNQLHLSELKMILKNASTYLLFLNEKDDSNLTVAERIVALFQFQIPYYVGPLNDSHKNNGGTAWVVRKEPGHVLPWNLEEKVDINASRQEFISRMVRRCTYMNEEQVLPKNSLLYEKFMVLNELNNVRIRGEKPSVELKQEIFMSLFMTGKKVTLKQLENYLIQNGALGKNEKDAISGIDAGFQTSLSSVGKFKNILGDRAKEWDIMQKIEKIIFWMTVYSNDKKVVRECINETFPDVFTKEELHKILGLKFRDWGRLSKEFLEMTSVSKSTGEIQSIIQAMWNEEGNPNLMELLSDKYGYMEDLENRVSNGEHQLQDFTYEDLLEYNLSAPVRRMVWQTILVLQDLQSVLPTSPDKIFVEMARGGGEKGDRKASRKKKFLELYKKCKEEGKDWSEEIDKRSEQEFRSKKLYLYYLQKGKCMYTGEPIDLHDLMTDNKYDIDHIYPRHFVKDDNIDNNLVLVKKEKNAHKSDSFPLEMGIRQAQYSWWKSLHDQGFMNDEKWKRLNRSEEFSDEDLAGFISRQLVETHQGTKAAATILKTVFPDTEIVFPKASNVSAFRQKYELFKVRNVNDFHHAQDAYLNIVVGNAYLTKFTKSPRHFIEEYRRDSKKYAYNMDRIFDRTIERGGVVAWNAASKESENQGSIVMVKKMVDRNSPLVTRMNFEAHGGITRKQTIWSAKKAKEDGYLPVKNQDGKDLPVERYGGFTDIATAYYILVEHEKKNKRIRTIEMVPIYLKEWFEESEENRQKYCLENLKLINPVIKVNKIKVQSLVKWNGFSLYITGRSNSQLIVKNAVPMYLNRVQMNYVKELGNFIDKGLNESDRTDVTREKNEELYRILLYKHYSGIYKKKPNALGDKLESWGGKFRDASLAEQVDALLQIINMTTCDNCSMEVKTLGFKVSKMLIGNNVSNTNEMLLIDQSPSGLYERAVDLKTI